MQSIKQLSIGLRNRAENRAYSGRVLLDELRLDEARNDPGLAAYAHLNTKLADFANLGGNVLWRQENFRSFTGQGGNSTDREAALSVSTNAQKLLPSSWGFLIPLKVNLSRTTSLPRFGPGSDVELTAEEKHRTAGRPLQGILRCVDQPTAGQKLPLALDPRPDEPAAVAFA